MNLVDACIALANVKRALSSGFYIEKSMLIFTLQTFFSLQMTDFSPPVCKVVNVTSNDCPQDVSMCGGHNWYLKANITDESGVDSLSLRQGSGNLTRTSLGESAVQANYRASCCSPIVELAAVDEAGNVGKCFHSIVSSDSPVSTMLLLTSMIASYPQFGLYADRR